MKILVKILIGIGAFIILLLVIAVFTKKSYTLQREVVMNKPAQEIYDYARMNENQHAYSSWYLMDNTTKVEMRGTDGEVGAVWAWESEKMGTGEQTIVLLEPAKQIDYKLHFIKPFEGGADNTVTFTAIDSTHTKVTSVFSSSCPYPLNLMLLVVDMDKEIGAKIQETLENMKRILEK